MKKHFEKHQNMLLAMFLFWVVFVAIFMRAWLEYGDMTPAVSVSEFVEAAKMTQKQDKVGANIRLLQAIHGVGGVDYRYGIETDCTKWDFQTKYVTSTPIDWIDETSAVEVIIYDTQIRYEGTVYASGQYYTVPILGGISSENKPLTTWQEDLMTEAYQTYASNANRNRQILTRLEYLIVGIPILFLIWLFAVWLKVEKEQKPQKDKDDNVGGTIDPTHLYDEIYQQVDELKKKDQNKETD